MTETTSTAKSSGPRGIAQALPFYYGWINVIVAAVAMTATLPGRTHGLGLITEPLLSDLSLTATRFANINFICTLCGAAFCIPVGWLIDRYGVRVVLTVVTLSLGLSVVGMSHTGGVVGLTLWLLLVRGFGQSALSLVSFSVVGKWFRRRLGVAMAVFAILLTFGFIASVLIMSSLIEQQQWRNAWNTLGWTLVVLAPVFLLLTRSTPESCGLANDPPPELAESKATSTTEEPDATVWQALASPAFWVLLLCSSMFNLVWSGVTLFNESILAERGIDSGGAAQIMAILAGVGLLANMISGPFASRKRIFKLLGVAMLVLAGGMLCFPTIETIAGARVYALAIGFSGGIVTVVFFAGWRHLFGRQHLGRIQGVAQLATVLASATGPLLMAQANKTFGSYDTIFVTLSAITAGLAVIAWCVRT